jgi:hypothetical protein
MRHHVFRPTNYQGIGWATNIPLTWSAGWLECLLQLRLSAAYTGGQSTVVTAMCVAVQKNPTTANAYFSLAKTFTVADTELKVDRWVAAKFVIASSRFTGKAGGRFKLWLMCDSSSTGPRLRFGFDGWTWPDPAETEPAEGFAWR